MLLGTSVLNRSPSVAICRPAEDIRSCVRVKRDPISEISVSPAGLNKEGTGLASRLAKLAAASLRSFVIDVILLR